MARQRLDYDQELGGVRALALFNQRTADCQTNDTGCFLFQGSLNTDGYGQIFAKKNSNLGATGRKAQTAFLIHIVAFLARNGHAPINHCSHLCDRRACFNPDHLVDEVATVNNSRKGCPGDIYCPVHGDLLAALCAHQPKCIRPPRGSDTVVCCLTRSEQRQHPLQNQPAMRALSDKAEASESVEYEAVEPPSEYYEGTEALEAFFREGFLGD